MKQNTFGRLNWKVSTVGYGMWGMAGWSESDDETSNISVDRAVELGCNFFDTAWGYGEGKSEQILGNLLKRQSSKKLYIATKIPPKQDVWPPSKTASIQDNYPKNHIQTFAQKSLKNLGVDTIDLLQFHVWEDNWADDDSWKEEVYQLKRSGICEGFGISVNRWEPTNCIKALKTGLIDSIQVIYNVFDQAPEDELFPYCQEHNIAIIARVPFDEGSLTGRITLDSKWEEGDFRNVYFGKENLAPTVNRVAKLQQDIGPGVPIAQTALQFATSHPAVSTTIAGMRQLQNVEANMKVGNMTPMAEGEKTTLRKHRWDRTPTTWSC